MTKAEEAQLLYTLLDAADSEDRLSNLAAQEKWREIKTRCKDSSREREYAALASLFNEVERSDQLAGTWILFRWSSKIGARAEDLVKRRKSRGLDQRPHLATKRGPDFCQNRPNA